MSKRILSLVLAFVMLVGAAFMLIACDNGNGNGGDNNDGENDGAADYGEDD